MFSFSELVNQQGENVILFGQLLHTLAEQELTGLPPGGGLSAK